MRPSTWLLPIVVAYTPITSLGCDRDQSCLFEPKPADSLCRAVGGHASSNHAAWLGLGLAAAVMWRRRRS